MSETQSMAGIPRAERYAKDASDPVMDHFRKVFQDIMTKSRTSTHSEEIGELAKALAQARHDFKALKRNLTGQEGNRTYKYADLKGIYEAVDEALFKNELALTHLCQEFAGQVELVTMLFHPSGQWLKSIYPVRAKTESAKSFGSAMTYAKRHSGSALLAIASEEDDDADKADTPPPVEKPTPAKKPTLVSQQPAQAPAKPAGKLEVMLADGSLQEFPRTQKGAVAALACIEQAVGERADAWGPNSEVAWTIAKELPQLLVREDVTAKMLVEQLEGNSVGPML